MNESTNDLYRLASEAGDFGSPAWERRLIEMANRIAELTIKPRLCGRFSSVFGQDDLVQETLLRLNDWITSPDPSKELNRSFVSATAQNTLIDALRRYLSQKRMPEGGIASCVASSTNLLNGIGSEVKTPLETSIASELWDLSIGCVDGDDRTFIELRYQEGLTQPEIAEMFGLSQESVRTRFSRLHKKIRERLADRSEFDSYR